VPSYSNLYEGYYGRKVPDAFKNRATGESDYVQVIYAACSEELKKADAMLRRHIDQLYKKSNANGPKVTFKEKLTFLASPDRDIPFAIGLDAGVYSLLFAHKVTCMTITPLEIHSLKLPL
jgi:hypothetical protein